MAESGPAVDRSHQRKELNPVLARHRAAVQGAGDAVAWAVALGLATLLRFDFDLGRGDAHSLALFVVVALAIEALIGFTCGLYTGRSRFGSFEEVVSLVKATAGTSAVLTGLNSVIDPRLVPASVPVIGGMIALLLMAGIRYLWRLMVDRRRRPSADTCQKLLVFGAGEGAVQVITALLKDPDSPYLPVALLDDDPAKRRLRILGVPVVGGRSKLAEVAASTGAATVLIAIPSAGSELVTEVSEMAFAAGLDVKVLPPVSELFGARIDAGDIRDVTPADLLGRHEIDTDLTSIAGYLTGKKVLVTGAGGSIGSELCRQIARFVPERLVMLDRDESALHAVQLAIEGRALLDSPDLVLCDLRDRRAVEEVFERIRPDVVFHAAALKHLTLLEQHPAEAVKTNVWSTLDLLEVTAETGVHKFVNISTDKAAQPCSVLGYSKRITERLTSHFAEHSPGTYLSVRFGNVLGSRGSMLTTFADQIERGGPVTVTDPEVTRYFMTVEEAAQLVVQAGAIGGAGEALVLDMGKPVVIAEVARLLVARSKRDVAIEFTGLRPGEKRHEVLLAEGEEDSRPMHPLISHVSVPPLSPSAARAIDLEAADQVIGHLSRLAMAAPAPAGVVE